MIDKLLVRPNPHNDESQESFLYRLAIQNHRTISDVSTLLSRSDSVSSRTRNRGDNGTSSFEKAARGLFNKREWNDRFKILFDLQFQKFCALCFAENPYVRTLWDFKKYVSCHKHGVALTNICDTCARPIRISSLFRRTCVDCNSQVISKINSVASQDPFSELIAKTMERKDISITEQLDVLLMETEQLKPYLRLVENGNMKAVMDLRKSNLYEYAALQSKAIHLMHDGQRSIQLLADQLDDRLSKLTTGNAISPYRFVINNPSGYKFSKVLKASLASNQMVRNDGELSLKLICTLWQIEEKALRKAFKEVLPGISLKKNQVPLSTFARYSKQIFTICKAR
ncbi:TniQ family protein [Idiomarina sp. ST20R2A10]|uniref:TniQ family protein n=1 Tax=Idiomarina sp. ST20R2A10 TaxID=3418369 RepID=UPI003EC5D243